MPMDRRAAPTHGEDSVGKARKALARLIAHGCKIGNQPDVPEQQRNREIGGNRKDVPHQRATELRLDSHGARVGKQPISIPRASQMQQRK